MVSRAWAAAALGGVLVLLTGRAGARGAGLRAGDRIAFGLQATPGALLVSIRRLAPPD